MRYTLTLTASVMLAAVLSAGVSADSDARRPGFLRPAGVSATKIPYKATPVTPGATQAKWVDGQFHYVAPMAATVIDDYVDLRERSKYDFTLYSLPTAAGQELTELHHNLHGRYGAFRMGDVYVVNYFNGPIHAPQYVVEKYDMSTWELLSSTSVPDASLLAECLAYNPVNKMTYGCFRTNGIDAGGYEIAIADYNAETPYRITIHKCESNADTWNACAFTLKGDLYAINYNGELLKVDKATGTGTVVGDTGLRPLTTSSATVDPETGTFYYIPAEDGYPCYVYEINLETAEATPVLKLPKDIVLAGLAPLNPIPDDAVPAMASEAAYTFSEGSLSGSVSFKMPQRDFGGKRHSGELAWEILDGETVVASGTSRWNSRVTADLTLPSSGFHDLVIVTKNDAGRSPRLRTRLYAGYDSPKAPSEVTLVYDNATGDVSLSWPAVTEGINGGYFTAADVRYRVTDVREEKVVADNLEATAFRTNISGWPELKNRPYRVEAIFNGLVSEPVESNPAVVGSVSLPFEDKYENLDYVPDGYHVINVMGDLNTWRPYGGRLQCYKNPDASVAMDDWLFTPPLHLEKGKIYQVSQDFAAMFSDSYGLVEKVEVFWGNNNVPSSMNNVGIPLTEIKGGDGMLIEWKNYSFNIIPEETGYYYVGIHGCSDANQGGVLLDNFAVSDAKIPGTPGAVTDFKVTPGANGAHKALIELKAPTTDVVGGELSPLTKIEIYGNGELVHTFESPAAGESLSYTDTPRRGGHIEYVAIPYNAYGAGATNLQTVYVGAYLPEAVRDLQVIESVDKPGEVSLSWTPPLRDQHAVLLTPEDLLYNIYKSEGTTDELIAEEIEGTTATLRACQADVQNFLIFGVSAISAAGEGPAGWSDMIPVGAPYPLPYTFSFTDEDFNKTRLIIHYLSDYTWSIVDDSQIADITSADNDNAFAGFRAATYGDRASLQTGKIAIPEGSDAVVAVSVYNLKNASIGQNNNSLEILCNDGTGWKSLRAVTVSDLPSDGWNRVIVPLKAYAGRSLRFDFIATCANFASFFIDDIEVTDDTESDLSVTRVEAPSQAIMGEKFKACVHISNNSASDVTDALVTLSVNGSERTSVVPESLTAGAETVVDVEMSFLPDDAPVCSLTAAVDWKSDAVPDNNVSAPATVYNVRPAFNAPETLAAASSEHGVVLTWNAPSADGNMPAPVIESFENYTPWTVESSGDWTFIDHDGGGIGGINGFQFPGEVVKGAVVGWWVMDSKATGLNWTFDANTGSRYIAQMYSADLNESKFKAVTCDDWAVSPLLPGQAQTVALYAKNYSPDETESFEILVSDKDSMSPEDYTPVKDVQVSAGDWTRFEFNIPEGARRFAVRCVSYNRFMLFVDDITFMPASDIPFDVTGYNVYRDGVRLNASPLAEMIYTDTDVSGDTREYYVTALWGAHGESVASNHVIVEGSSLETVGIPSRLSVTGGHGEIIVRGAEGLKVDVFNAAAMKVASVDGADYLTIPQIRGVYMVCVGGVCVKVVVR